MSELSDLLRAAKGDSSYEAIATKARKAGHRLSPSAVAKYIRDEHKGRTPDETLLAFAAGFDLDVRVLREAAGRQGGELGPYVPDSRANSLTKDQRDALDRLIVTIVEQGGSDAGTTREKSPGRSESGMTQSDVTLAARTVKDDRTREREQQWDDLGTESQDSGGMDPA